MCGKAYRWVKRNLQVINVGWIYVLYSQTLKMWKLGRTELTMKRRMANYEDHWKVSKKIFCKDKLRQTERDLLKWARTEKQFKVAKKKEYFYLRKEEVTETVEYIEFLIS